MDARTAERAASRVPDDLESATAKLVYLYLDVREEATADDVCDALGVNKGTVLAIVRTLRERDHVRRVDDRYVVA